MNFGMIFLCLLIGCVIGFEAGKAVMIGRVRGIFNNMSAQLKSLAEELQKKKQEAKQNEQLSNGSKGSNGPDCEGRPAVHETEQ